MKFCDLFNQHTLVAGTTGSGKSVLLNNIICDYLNTPNTHLILCDPKKVEFAQYRKCEKVQYFNTPESINGILRGLKKEEQKRQKKMLKQGLKMSTDAKIIVVIDEIADLLTAYNKQSKEFEKLLLTCLATMRSANITFIVATQNPSRSIISNKIQVNLPIRCGLRCQNPIESRLIINQNGCECLPKYGEMLVKSPDFMEIQRLKFGINADYINETIKYHS